MPQPTNNELGAGAERFENAVCDEVAQIGSITYGLNKRLKPDGKPEDEDEGKRPLRTGLSCLAFYASIHAAGRPHAGLQSSTKLTDGGDPSSPCLSPAVYDAAGSHAPLPPPRAAPREKSFVERAMEKKTMSREELEAKQLKEDVEGLPA